MSPTARTVFVVALACVAGGALAVAGALVTGKTRDTSTRVSARVPERPVLQLDLGVRDDAEAAALRRAERHYDAGEVRAARAIFARYRSLEARVGAAVAAWPRGSIRRLRSLARNHPRSALVALHLGLALAAAGAERPAVAAWRTAARAHPDSASAVRAGDLLHPDVAPGLPIFVPSFAPPPRVARLPPERQLHALARAARTDGVRARLLYGVALQRLGRPRSASRQYAAAAAAARADPEPQVAAAVGTFEKARPHRAVSRVRLLARRFPKAATVRFHLGLLLLWVGEVRQARRQLVLARTVEPSSPLAREANRFLAGLESGRSERRAK